MQDEYEITVTRIRTADRPIAGVSDESRAKGAK